MLMVALFYLDIVFGIFFDLKLVLWAYHLAAAILYNIVVCVTFASTLQHGFDFWCYPCQNL